MKKEIEEVDFDKALWDLECLYDDAKIEADWIKDRVITYAEEHEHNDRIKPYYEHIKQALTTKSKKEQAFDIVNKKCVDMYRLSVVNDVNSYNKWTEFDEYWLTEEEFNLIKEVLKNE